jgi:hypothetical protein
MGKGWRKTENGDRVAFMTIAEGIAAARLAMDAGSKAIDLLRYPKIDGEAVRTRITEMQDLVFSAQRALGEAEDENRNLKRQLDDQDALRTLEADLEFHQDGGFLRRKSELVRKIDNPVCPLCWEVDRKAAPLKLVSIGAYKCVLHKVTYTTKTYEEEQERQRKTTAEKNVIVWLNEYFGEVSKDGKLFEEFRVAQEQAEKLLGTVVIRERNPNTYGDDMRQMLSKRLTFDEAIRLGEFSLVSKQRLTIVRRELFEQLDRIEME